MFSKKGNLTMGHEIAWPKNVSIFSHYWETWAASHMDKEEKSQKCILPLFLRLKWQDSKTIQFSINCGFSWSKRFLLTLGSKPGS